MTIRAIVAKDLRRTPARQPNNRRRAGEPTGSPAFSPMKTLLSNVAEILAGYQFRGRIPVYDPGTVGVIQGKDVRSDHTIDPSTIVRIKDDGSFDRFYVQKDDVLLMNRGSRNYAAIVETALPRTVTLSSFCL